VDERFETDLRTGYPDDASGVVLGSPMLDGEVLAGVRVRLPLSTVNRHGLVAGATGTGEDQDAAGDRWAALGRGGAGVRR
jgi:DNA helicase HerA-like ATPase